MGYSTGDSREKLYSEKARELEKKTNLEQRWKEDNKAKCHIDNIVETDGKYFTTELIHTRMPLDQFFEIKPRSYFV